MIQIIAEIGQAHEGSIGMAHAYIDAVAKTGCNAIKFQTHIADAESSIHEPFRVKFSKQDATRFDYWQRMEFTLEQWKGLKTHCDEVALEFISSPFSNAAVDLLEKVGLLTYFDTIVDGNSVTKAKPDPEVFLIGAQKLNMKPEVCIVVEDAIAGVEAANAANMLSIGIGDAEVLKEADYVLSDTTGFTPDFLQKLLN